jgi:hypothetical protein
LKSASFFLWASGQLIWQGYVFFSSPRVLLLFPDLVSVLFLEKREEEEGPLMGGHEIVAGVRKA